MNRILSTSVAMIVAMAPCVAHAAEPTATVDVDVSALPDDEVTRGLQQRMLEHQRETLTRGGVEIEPDASNRIEVTVRRYGEGGIHTEADVVLFMGGATTPEGMQTIRCELCRDSELVAKVGEEVARLSGRILYAPSEAEDNQSAAVEPDPSPAEPRTQNERAKPIGVVGGIGIVLGVAGIATAVAGGVDLGRGEVVDDSDFKSPTTEDFRPRGRVLLGTGLAGLAVGAIMLGVDLGVLAKKRREQGQARIRLGPGPGWAGASIRGQF